MFSAPPPLQASQLQQARQWEESVLPHIFTGPNGGARENALEQEVESLLPRLQQVSAHQQGSCMDKDA